MDACEDRILAYLLRGVAGLPAEPIRRAAVYGACHGVSLEDTLVGMGLLLPVDAAAYRASARSVEPGSRLRSCANCQTQLVAKARMDETCPRCRNRLRARLLAAPDCVLIDGGTMHDIADRVMQARQAGMARQSPDGDREAATGTWRPPRPRLPVRLFVRTAVGAIILAILLCGAPWCASILRVRDTERMTATLEAARRGYVTLLRARTNADHATRRHAFERTVTEVESVCGADSAPARYWRARAAWTQGRLREAHAGFRHVTAMDASHLDAWIAQGLCAWMLAGRYENPLAGDEWAGQAEGAFLSAGRIAPESPQGRFAAMMLGYMSGNTEEALDAFSEIGKEDLCRADVRFAHAYGRLQTGAITVAAADLETARLDHSSDPYLALAQGLALLAVPAESKGTAADLERLAEIVPTRWPDFPEGWVFAASAHLALGRSNDAREAVRRALELDPHSAVAQRLSASLAGETTAMEDPPR